jgi:hypothetical protein
MIDFLLRMEAVNFSSFLDDTSDVSTIRGGGLLLLDAPSVLDSITGLERVYAGASSALFKFSAADHEAAERMRKDAEDKLHVGDLSEATIVVDVAPLDAAGSFKGALDRLMALNRWRQLQTPSLAFPALNDTDGIDELDDKRPAVERPGMLAPREEHETQRRPMMLSAVTYARRKYGIEQKRKFYARVSQDTPELRAFPFHSGGYVNDLEQLAQFKEAKPPDLNGKLAYIYLDGNKFGSVARGCNAPDLLHNWSECVQANQNSFLGWLLRIQAGSELNTPWHWSDPAGANTVGEDEKQRLFRIETLLWGGDEIVWVVPAWCGWWMLGSFFAHYGRLPWNRGGPAPRTYFESDRHYRLSHGAGIVFCHATAPIRRIRDLTKHLADAPKTLGTQGAPIDYTDYFAYQVLESFDHLGADPDGMRKRQLPAALQTLPSDPLILPGAGMLDIFAPMETFRQKFPRGKIHQLVRQFRTSESEGLSATWASASTELKRTGTVDEFAALTGYFGRTSGDSQTREIVTWLHIAELWDYTPPPGWTAPPVPPIPQVAEKGR